MGDKILLGKGCCEMSPFQRWEEGKDSETEDEMVEGVRESR